MKLGVWDLPTRLFHWTLVALIAFSWWSAEEDRTDWHVWSGIVVVTLLIFRLLWGFVGSSTARFSNFVRGPGAVLGYLRGQWSGIGHSPLGALSVVALLLLVAVQVGLGLFSTHEDGFVQGPLAHLVSADTSDDLRDLHGDAFDLLLVFIGLHVAAVLFYRLVMGKKLVKPMITGVAEIDPKSEPMQPASWWAAGLCLMLAIGASGWVTAGAPPFG